MDTICRDCVFAEWHGNKQADCKMGRLFTFIDNGTEVKLEQDPVTNKQYARIVDRLCNTCRDAKSLEDTSSSKWVEHVREEVTAPVALAVYLDDDNKAHLAYQSLASIVAQTVTPYEIILIYNVEGRTEVHPNYASWFFMNCEDIKWRIQHIRGIAVPLKAESQPADYGQAVDLSVQSEEMKAIYFAVCKAGYQFTNDYIEVIDKAINDKMDRFVALLPDEDGNAMFVQRRLHKLLQGNKAAHSCTNIIEKILQIAEEEGTQHMVKRFDDLK